MNDAVEIMPSFYYQHLQIADTSAYWVALSNPDQERVSKRQLRHQPEQRPVQLDRDPDQVGPRLRVAFLQHVVLRSQPERHSDYTQYLRATWNSFGELPNTFPAAGDNGYATFQDNQRNFYEELRLSSKDTDSWLVWSGGLFYSRLSENVPENIYDPTLNQEVINYTGGLASVCYRRSGMPRRADLQRAGRQRGRQAGGSVRRSDFQVPRHIQGNRGTATCPDSNTQARWPKRVHSSAPPSSRRRVPLRSL